MYNLFSVFIKGKTYNIPICVWIEPNYPNSPPMCYVKPTCEMIIVKGKYISSDGEVTIPYLKDWKKVKKKKKKLFLIDWNMTFIKQIYIFRLLFVVSDIHTSPICFSFLYQGKCDLPSLLQVMAIMFGEVPPLAMRSYPEPEQASCK